MKKSKKVIPIRNSKRRAAPTQKAVANDHFKKRSTRVTMSSKDHTWRTPQHLLDLIRRVAGSSIKFDPAADETRERWFARNNVNGINGNGLQLSWRGKGLVYCNPPYGRGIKKWVQHAMGQFWGDKVPDPVTDELFMLVPARPDTRWFQDLVLPAMSAVCFWKGRLRFSDSDPAPFPSVIIYIGPNVNAFVSAFRNHGWVIKNNH